MGISEWNWSILHIWQVTKRYKWFTLSTFIPKIKENRNTRCKFFKLEISCVLQTLKSISENLMASWKNHFDNYIFCRQSGVIPGNGKLWCMDKLEWTMFINLNQRTLDVIANIIFNYHLFCLCFFARLQKNSKRHCNYCWVLAFCSTWFWLATATRMSMLPRRPSTKVAE